MLLDHAEDNLFAILRELQDERHVPESMLAAVLADCKEEERMREVFEEHRPSVVFHAAAYKHVGLMEANPVEAIRNNAIATQVVAHVAGAAGAARFVLVSTDKAVSPATVMGASKALAEFALEAATARFPQTRYAAVRFGNVLGSSGSVVPIFRRQIERGGPVTVTDERMTRYFMTIPEAVQLIIRSGSLAAARSAATDARRPRISESAGAEVFVLDMGEPVRIVELARAMIELSGLDPDRDIDVEIVGRRPGREAPRGAVQQLRARARRPTPRRSCALSAARSACRPSKRCSRRSGCWCSRATPRGSPRRSRSSRSGCARPMTASRSRTPGREDGRDASPQPAVASAQAVRRGDGRTGGRGSLTAHCRARRLRPSYTPQIHEHLAARPLDLHKIHRGRRDRRIRGAPRDSGPVAARLLTGP